jgi:hypothetical protein
VKSFNTAGLNHYVPHIRPIHTELACSDTVGVSKGLLHKTYQRTQRIGVAKEIWHVTLRSTINETNAAVESLYTT